MKLMLVLLALTGCDSSVDGPWEGFSIHPVVESGGTTLPQRDNDTPLQVGDAVMDGSCITAASVDTDPLNTGIIKAEFTSKCREALADFTEENVGKQIALVVRGEVVSAPVVNERIESGEVHINLGGEVSEAQAEQMLSELSGK